MLVVFHTFCYNKLWLRHVFTAATIFFFVFVGFFTSYRSHRQSFVNHGERFRYEIYHSNNFQSTIALDVRQRLHQFFSEYSGISKDEASVIEVMTIGWREDMSPSLRSTFSRAGISHLLALSGYHLGLILYVFYALFYSNAEPRKKPYLTVLMIALMWGYAFVTGMSPSMIRAVLMFTIALTGNLYKRTSTLMYSTLIAAVIILLVEPLFVSHVGFQLSFASMFGISLIHDRIRDCNAFLAPIIITLVCTAFTFPLVAHFFGTVSLVGVLANVVASVIVPIIMCLSALWWLAAPLCSEVSHMIAIPLEWLTSFLIATADTLSSLCISTISYRPTIPSTIILYALILTIFTLFHLCFPTKDKGWKN